MSDYAESEPDVPETSTTPLPWFHGSVTTTTLAPLTAADRCDRCGAQAYVRVVLPTGDLFFCGHHARKHAPAFADVALHIQDETDRLAQEHGRAD